jgi:flagellar basal body rod protein FlgG
MLFGLYASGLGAIGMETRLNQIANNLANVNTPGYRRDHLAFSERVAAAMEGYPDLKHYNLLVHRYGGAPFIDQVRFDRDPGGVEATTRPLDFAIRGEGFFRVRDRNTDKTYYTRAGNFILDSLGNVVTPDGKYQLLDEGGAGVAVDPLLPETQLRLDPDGNFFQGPEFRARIGVVNFENLDGIRKHGDNLFENFATVETAAPDARLQQSALEGSSVNPVVEMVEMIKTIRAIESNLQMIRIQDSVLDRTVNEFGRPTR